MKWPLRSPLIFSMAGIVLMGVLVCGCGDTETRKRNQTPSQEDVEMNFNSGLNRLDGDFQSLDPE